MPDLSFKITRILQILFAVSSYLKIFTTIYLFGLEGAGITGLAISILFTLTLTSGLVNNQALQVIYMNENEKNQAIILKGFKQVILFNGIFSAIVIMLFLDTIFYVNFVLLSFFILATWSTLYIALFEFYAVVTNKSDLIMIGHSIGSVAFLITLVIFYSHGSGTTFIFIAPAVGSVITSLVFIFLMQRNVFFSSSNTGEKWYSLAIFLSYLGYIKKIWRFALIPVSQAVCDYVIRQVLVLNSGFTAVGLLQLIQSIDALIGNIFAAPILRKSLFYFTKSKKILITYFTYLYLNLIYPNILLLILTSFAYYFSSSVPRTYQEKISLIVDNQFYIYVFIFAKTLNLLWGICAQLLLSAGRRNFVANIELLTRLLLLFLFLIFYFYIVKSVGAYVIGYCIVWMLLVPVCLGTIRKYTAFSE